MIYPPEGSRPKERRRAPTCTALRVVAHSRTNRKRISDDLVVMFELYGNWYSVEIVGELA